MAEGKREGWVGGGGSLRRFRLNNTSDGGYGGRKCTYLRARTLPAAEAASMPSGSSWALIAAMMAAMVACNVLPQKEWVVVRVIDTLQPKSFPQK